MTQKVTSMLSRVTMRKSGLAEYLEKGKRADSKHSRLEKDHVIPLYGSLDVLRKAEEHCLRTKKWNYNYEHITISFSNEDEEVLNAMTPAAQNATLQDIAKMMVRHRTYGYDLDNEVIAYAEVHAPKIQEETNMRTGEIQSRKKHIHIGISYLNSLSDTKLRTTFFNSSYISDTIDRYIAKKHGLHDASPTQHKTGELKENPREKTHIALERKAIKTLLAPVKNQEELLQILEEKNISYKVAKGKTGTYIKLINPHGKNINLRGKDFKHLEIFGSTVLSLVEKAQHLKELKNKSLHELEAILERYYKEQRLPMIEKRRSKKDTQKLKAIHEKEQALHKEHPQENSFSFFQEKLFYEHYHHKVQKSLQGYSVNTKDKRAVTFIHKEKEIHIEDKGDKITANASIKNLQEKVALMIEIARAKGWDLATLEINGSKAFKEEVSKQIAQILREKEQLQQSNDKTQEINLPRPKTPLQYDLKSTQEKAFAKQLPLTELKSMLAAKSVLAYAEKHYKLDPSKYAITDDNKINNLRNKQKPKNVIDFLQKELNFSTKEAIETCQTLYDAQPLVTEVKNNVYQLSTPVTLDIKKENRWQSITIEDYTALAHTLKSHPYSQRDHQVPGTLHPLLIYTISQNAQSNSLSIDTAKTLLQKQNIPALLLPLKEGTYTHENTKTQSYRIFIPLKNIQDLTEKNQAHVHQNIAKQLGLHPYIYIEEKNQGKNRDYTYTPHPLRAVPHFTKVPKDTEILNIDESIEKANKAIEKKEKNQAILERAKKALQKRTHNPTPTQAPQDKTNLMRIDTQALNALDVSKLVKAFEEIKEDTPLQDFTFLQTKEHKYLYDSNNTNYLYDIKADKVIDTIGYLKQVFQSDDLETIVDTLEEKLDTSFRMPNHKAIQEQFNYAKKVSTSIFELCKLLGKHFSVSVTLKEDILTLGNITLPLEKLGSNKETLIQELTHNALKVAAKENQELAKENSTHKPKGRDFGGM
jgi:hypothetical protein